MAEVKHSSLVKPTLQTPFHIDFSWWKQNDRDWRVHLRSLLCLEHQEAFVAIDQAEKVDWVDPVTAEVQKVDGLQHVLLSHCAQEEDFLDSRTALTEAIFRLFMKNGNTPMSVGEIAEKLERKPIPILRTLSGGRVYRGVRPVLD
ncbi:MAG: hypothetical protein FVQ83_07320 [Chloroflexi bacterium]|nr:hypothetical protein [Chloroflexota bacterium]